MNSVQSKMARAALGFGVRDLAKHAKVSPDTIARLERGEDLKETTIVTIRTALETAGVEFIDANGGGPGVRLKRPDAPHSAPETATDESGAVQDAARPPENAPENAPTDQASSINTANPAGVLKRLGGILGLSQSAPAART